MEVELVPISWLKPHEEVKPSNVDSLHDITLRWNAYTKPLLVDGRTGTILAVSYTHLTLPTIYSV